MQKRAYLLIFSGLAIFMAISLIMINYGNIFPIEAESRIAIVFNDSIGQENFVEATNGAQKILNTMVNIADFSEVRKKVINSGFEVTDNIFVGTAKENNITWEKYVHVKPIDDAFVLEVSTTGRNEAEAVALADVVAHEINLEIPKLFTNLRGISDEPKLVNFRTRANIFIGVIFLISLGVVTMYFWENNQQIVPKEDNLEKVAILPEKKHEGDPRYFLQKFLEEHQKQ